MGTFIFEIRDAFHPLDGYDGDATLAGVQVGDEHLTLVVGDVLMVPVSDGRIARMTVAQLPLMCFTDPELRALSVTGVEAADVQVGGRAERIPTE